MSDKRLSISAISLYPIKSLGGIALTSAQIGKRGLRHDRAWMVVDENGRFLTQREHPKMALVHVSSDGAGAFVLEAPQMHALRIDESTCAKPARVTVWRDSVDAKVASGEVAEWFSSYLGARANLAYFAEESRRPVDPRFANESDQVSFADGFPILVATEASLADLNDRLDERVPMNRFRPNLVIAGAAPWEEDDWTALALPNVRLRIAKPCGRCIIVNTDQRSAERSKEPLRTLSGFRKIDDSVLFGQNAIPDSDGEVALGDVVVRYARSS